MLELLNIEDVNEVMIIIDAAKERMKEDVLIQWQDGYPNRDTILNDIQLGQIYKYVENDVICAIAVINDDFYEPYPSHANKDLCKVIHRVATKPEVLGKGIGTKLFAVVEDKIREMGCQYALADTYTLNIKMRGLIEKSGYDNMGEFELVEGAPNWVLYQKKLT